MKETSCFALLLLEVLTLVFQILLAVQLLFSEIFAELLFSNFDAFQKFSENLSEKFLKYF